MNIMQRSRTKKQILNNLEEARQIYAKMKKCLVPAQNINWCHRIDPQNFFDNENHLRILKLGIPSLLTYSNQFTDLYFINNKLCLDCPKLQEFSENYFVSQSINIFNHIQSLIRDITELNDYLTSSELKKTTKLLEIALKNVESNYVRMQTFLIEEKMSYSQ